MVASNDPKLRERDWAERFLPKLRLKANGEGVCCCELAGHNDSTPSLLVNLNSGQCTCRRCNVSMSLVEYAKATGKPPYPVLNRETSKDSRLSWVYQDLSGRPVLRVTRYERDGRKAFFQEIPDGRGGWTKGGLGPKKRPLYNAPALASAPLGSLVFIVEGEKAAEWLIQRGLLATTAPEGAGKFDNVDPEYLDLLVSLGPVVLPDNDEPGAQHAIQVALVLDRACGVTAKILELPGLPPKGDIVDWLVAPRTNRHLLDLVPKACSVASSLGSAQEVQIELLGDPGPCEWSREQPSEVEKLSVWDWDEPEPIETLPPAMAFPLNCLAEKVALFVDGRAEELQTPLDLQALTLLGAASVPLLGAVSVNAFGSWIEPINLLCAPIAPPGERKSATVQAIFAPHNKEEARITGMFEAEKRRRRAAKRLLELELRDAKKDGDSDRISALHEKIEELEPPTRPQLILDDSTDEGRALVMSQNKGRIGLASAEGTLFSGVARYSADGAPRVDTILKGHAGDELRINRVGRDPIIIAKVHIGGCIMAQPDVIKRLAKHEDLKGVGFLARWFWSYPESKMGRRNVSARPCPDQCYTDWDFTCRRLFTLGADLDNPRVLRLHPQAVNRLRDWMAEIEPLLVGELAFMCDWAAKLAGLSVRLAGALHCLDHGSSRSEAFSELIVLSTLERAIQISRYALAHARRAYFLMGYKANQPAEVADLEILSKLAKLESGKSISVREFHRKVDNQPKFKRKESLDLVLGVLRQKGWLRIASVSTGGRPSDHIQLHPRFRELIQPLLDRYGDTHHEDKR